MSELELHPRSVEELRELERQGQRLKLLLFWGHQPSPSGGVGPGCLSQWWHATFTVEGVGYPTAEHFMMAQKARLFGDEETTARILAAPRPGAAKSLGRQVRGFDETIWAAHRYEIVVKGNAAKFAQHQPLRDYLLGTRGRILVEASPVDSIWGIGLAPDDERAQRPSAWRGLNLLGFALMDVRAALGRA
jgi:ribA/ribD-fused uncharacterized protein